MSAGDLSIYGEWLVQEANGCTCQGSDTHYGHQPGCGYEPLVKLEVITDALKAAGYAVVELPAPDGPLGFVGGEPKGLAWRRVADPEAGGLATVAVSGWTVGEVTAAISCLRTTDDARWAAAALLAAAVAAEHPGTPVEASPQEQP